MTEQRNEETKLYSIRWFIIFLVGFVAIVSRTLRSSFGVVNDVYVSYFNISYELADWFTLIMLPGCTISCVLFFILFTKSISIRNVAIMMSGSLSFTCICLIIAYVHMQFYPLILVGNFALGFVIAAIDLVSASYAINWFPEHQVGIALSANELGCSIGSLLGYIIPSNILLVPKQLNSTNITCSSITTQKPNTNQNLWFFTNQLRLIIFSSVLLTIVALIFLCFAIFMKDKPPLPPTKAQAKVRLQSREHEAQSGLDKTQLLQLLRTVTFNKVFWQVIFILSTSIGACDTFVKMFMGEILKKLFIKIGDESSYNSFSSLMLVCYEVGGIIGSILSGKIVDNFKNYHHQISVILAICLMSMISILLGYYFNSVVVLYVFYFSFGTCLGYLPTPSYEIVFQQFYPIDSGVLALMIRIVYSFINFTLGETPRWISNLLSSGIQVTVGLCMFILLSISFLTSLFLKPSYNRLAVNRNSEVLNEEETPILSGSVNQN